MPEDVGMHAARTLVDEILEVLVVPSFTRIGYRIRSHLFRWTDPETLSMAGRTVVLTGPTSGLGRETAGSLARMGARLVLVGRDAGRLARTRDEILAETPGAAVATVVADMASLASVRAAATEITNRRFFSKLSCSSGERHRRRNRPCNHGGP